MLIAAMLSSQCWGQRWDDDHPTLPDVLHYGWPRWLSVRLLAIHISALIKIATVADRLDSGLLPIPSPAKWLTRRKEQQFLENCPVV
jgi:hypothetical protein